MEKHEKNITSVETDGFDDSDNHRVVWMSYISFI